ncbi:MAG TPA: helix-turn-helix transcriptional regulator [Beijerinckiaceae bacterium]|jgi:DNA-binding transcriptional ArsR family regulator
MASVSDIAEIGALVGDPARAGMLASLLDGRALTAAELARVAGVTPQTASGHLARLAATGLLKVEKQGRHRYHRLASPAVAQMLEGIMQVAALAPRPGRASVRVGPSDKALRTARTCYDHLAGRLGVAIADALILAGHLEFSEDGGALSASGAAFLTELGVDLPAAFGSARRARVFCRPCLDWSERRPHVAGLVGRAICHHCMERGWVRRIAGTRALEITPKGVLGLRTAYGVGLN